MAENNWVTYWDYNISIYHLYKNGIKNFLVDLKPPEMSGSPKKTNLAAKRMIRSKGTLHLQSLAEFRPAVATFCLSDLGSSVKLVPATGAPHTQI